MTTNDLAGLFKDFRRQLVAEVKRHGFVRGGGEYVRDGGEGYCVLRFQCDKYNDAVLRALTVNVGGGSEFLWRAVPIGFERFEKRYGVVPFGRRLGWSTHEDKWYRVTANTAIDGFVADFRMRMEREVLPFARRFETLQATLDSLRSDYPAVPSQRLQDQYIAAIEAELARRGASAS